MISAMVLRALRPASDGSTWTPFTMSEMGCSDAAPRLPADERMLTDKYCKSFVLRAREIGCECVEFTWSLWVLYLL